MEDDTDLRGPVEDSPSNVVAIIQQFVDPVDALMPSGYLGTREEIEKELDLIAAAIRLFHRKQPDQILRECGGFSARLTELAVLLHRNEAGQRQYTRIRTQQVDRYLKELEFQWKTASRLIEVNRQDLQLLGKD